MHQLPGHAEHLGDFGVGQALRTQGAGHTDLHLEPGPIELGKLTGHTQAEPSRLVRLQSVGKHYFSCRLVDHVPVPVQLGLELLDEPAQGSAVTGNRLRGLYPTALQTGNVGRRLRCRPDADASRDHPSIGHNRTPVSVSRGPTDRCQSEAADQRTAWGPMTGRPTSIWISVWDPSGIVRGSPR